MSHAILDGMHRMYLEPSNPDSLAFHEAFADIFALLQHFTMPEAVTRSEGCVGIFRSGRCSAIAHSSSGSDGQLWAASRERSFLRQGALALAERQEHLIAGTEARTLW